MLGRTANDLFWMTRYIERAENMARLLDVGYRIVLLPRDAAPDQEGWRSTLLSAGCDVGYRSQFDDYDTAHVLHYLLFEPSNPSSIYSCLTDARRNARIQRTAITREMWENVNRTWQEFFEFDPSRITLNELPQIVDWIKERSASFRGALLGTILRNDGFQFCQIGTFLERADNTARILDVKYYVLLPQTELVGSGIDSVQWASILRSVSAHRSYGWVYRGGFRPWNIADFLILSHQMPRSLWSCYQEITTALDALSLPDAAPPECHRLAREIVHDLAEAEMTEIFQTGLHEFLGNFIARNTRLGFEIAKTYHFNS